MFTDLDTDGDHKIELSEFNEALPTMLKWGVQINDIEATFNEIDKDGDGFINFDEFVNWATSKNISCQINLKENENLVNITCGNEVSNLLVTPMAFSKKTSLEKE